MSDTVETLPDGIEPFSLYMELEAGKLIDLEVAARIALALGAAIREAAFIIDPSMDVRIDLVSGTEGSFSFNTFLKSIKPKDLLARRNLLAVAAFCAMWFIEQTAEYTYERLLDHFLDQNTPIILTVQDKTDLAKQISDLISKDIAKDKIQTVYQQLNSDPKIKSVGVARKPGEKPSTLVPRTEFHARAGFTRHDEAETASRVRIKETTVTLISPVLVDESVRRWRVETPDGEFGATMKDEGFLKSIVQGKIRIEMVGGIQMVVILETKEVLKDGVWHIRERNILKVERIIEPHQGRLDLNPS